MSIHNVQDLIDQNATPNWELVNEFLLSCGQAHDPKSFAAAIISGSDKICSCERAYVFFLDGNSKVSDHSLLNISNETHEIYLQNYANRKDDIYSVTREYREKPDHIHMPLYDWTDEPNEGFIKDYIRTQNLSYSLGLVFFDLYGNPRTAISLDRCTMQPFSKRDLLNLYTAIPHLNNLHKNFFYSAGKDSPKLQTFSSGNSNLTKREAEIANLLCQGISPANISSTLFISTATTYKHISNIYEKLGISSQRELLSLLLNQ